MSASIKSLERHQVGSSYSARNLKDSDFQPFSRKPHGLQCHQPDDHWTSLKLSRAAQKAPQCRNQERNVSACSRAAKPFCNGTTRLKADSWGSHAYAQERGIGRNVQRSSHGSSAEGSVAIEAFTFRPAKEQDMPRIQWLVLKEAMNPLNLLRERFLVAENAAGQLVACGQVADIPGDPPIRELRSLVVVKEHRGQGIGTALLQKLLSRVQGDVYILTIGRAVSFYERAGFKEVSEIPAQLKLELKLGGVVAKVAAQDRCLVMKATQSK